MASDAKTIPPPNLLELQQRFKSAIRNEDAPSPEALARLGIRGSSRFPAGDRLEVYRYAYRARMLESLTEDFPSLCELMGAGAFEALCHEYLTQIPSRSPDLGDAGRLLPAFLRENPPWNTRQDHIEAAELDWLECEAFVAPDPEEAHLLPPGKLLSDSASGALALHASVRWHASDSGERWIVWRSSAGTRRERIPKNQLEILSLFRDGPIPVDALASRLETLDLSESDAHDFFERWMREEILVLLKNDQSQRSPE